MQIERTTDEIVIRLPAWVKLGKVENLLDYLVYCEATSKSEATFYKKCTCNENHLC